MAPQTPTGMSMIDSLETLSPGQPSTSQTSISTSASPRLAFLPFAYPIAPTLKPLPTAISSTGHEIHATTLHVWNSIAQETCRDFVHAGCSLTNIGYVANVALTYDAATYAADVGARYGLGFHNKHDVAIFPKWGL